MSFSESQSHSQVDDVEMRKEQDEPVKTIDLVSHVMDLAQQIVKFLKEKHEAIEDLRSINQLLNDHSIELFSVLDQDQSRALKKDFYSKVLKDISSQMLSEIVCTKAEYLPQILQFFRNILVNYFPQDIASEDLAEIVHNIFNFEANLYTHALNAAIKKKPDPADLTEFDLTLDKRRLLSEQMWRKNLKVGDILDCVKMKQAGTNRVSHWSKATVYSEPSIENDNLSILFINEVPHPSALKIVKRESLDIAPRNTFTDDFNWRFDLQPGDLIDCFDAEMWYRSTVLETRFLHNNMVKEVQVAYRVYEEEGSKNDDDGRKFTGWSNRYDEWKSVTCPTIQRYNTLCKHYTQAGKNLMVYDYGVDDSQDVIFNTSQRKIWAVYLAASPFANLRNIPDYLNEFGAKGGYEQILEFFSSEDKRPSLRHIYFLMDFLSKTQCLWQRQFSCYFIPKLKEAFEKALLRNRQKGLSPLQQKFSKDNLTQIQKSYQNIIRKYYTTTYYTNILTDLQFQIGFTLLNSDKLEQRIVGLKEVIEQVNNAKFSNMRRSISAREIAEKLKQEDIIQKIFGDNYHIQLIQRSSEIIRFMVQERYLDKEDIDTIWSATKKDQQTKMEVYKIILDVAVSFNNKEIELLIDKFSQVPPDEFVEREIECVYELSRQSAKQTNLMTQSANLFWEIATLRRPYKKQIVDIAIEKFLELIKNWNRQDQDVYTFKCIDNIQNHQASLQSVKIIQKIIEGSSNYKMQANPGLRDFVNQLINEHSLLDSLISDLAYYLKYANDLWSKNVLNENNVDSFEMQNLPFSHRSHLFIRLSFFKQALIFSHRKIEQEQLDKLWDLFLVQSKISIDSDVFFLWFKQLLTNNNLLTPECINHFFQTKVCSPNVNFKGIKKVGFDSICSLFFQINENLEKLQIISQNSGLMNGQQQTKLEFRIHVPPNELEGCGIIWKILEECDKSMKNDDVTSLVIDLLTKIYHSVSSVLEDTIHQIEDQFIEECLKRLKAVIENPNNTDDEKNQMTRIVQAMLKSFFEESEKQGTGNLRAHALIEKKEYLVNVVVQNNITYQKSCPKILVFNVYQNINLWDLKKQIGIKTKTSPLMIQLNRSEKNRQDLKDQDNCKSLKTLRIESYEILTATKKAIITSSRVPLLTKNKELVPEAKKIFQSWFDTFSNEEGFMTPETCVEFIKSSIKDVSVTIYDSRITSLFDTYDSNHDGKLTKEEFLHFYKDKSLERPELVWSNLDAHHISNNLKPNSAFQYTDNDPNEIKDPSVLPRYKLSTNQNMFDLLFSLIEQLNREGQEKLWNLITSLRTNPRVYMNILGLSGIQEIVSEKTSIFKKLYCLQIMVSFMYEYAVNRDFEVVSYFTEQQKEEYPSLSVNQSDKSDPQNAIKDDKLASAPESGFALPLLPAWQGVVSAKVGGNIPEPPPIMNSNSDAITEFMFPASAKDKEKTMEFIANFKGPIVKDVMQISTFTDDDLREYLPGDMNITLDVMKKRWLPTFIEIGGFQLLLQLLTQINENNQGKKPEEILNSSVERESLTCILRMMKVLIMTSISSGTSTNQDLLQELNRKMSSVQEEEEGQKAVEEKKEEGSQSKKDVKKEQEDLAKEFEPLIKLFQEELHDKILSNLDFQAFQDQILSIIQLVLRKKKIGILSDERNIIDQLLSLWICCLLFNSDLLQSIYDQASDLESNKLPIAKILIGEGLLNDSFQIRESFKESLLFICQAFTSQNLTELPIFYFLRLLIKELGNLETKWKQTNQFFRLFESLLHIYFDIEQKSPNVFKKLFDVQDFLKYIVKNLMQYDSKEEKKSLLEQDSNLIGYLKLIAELISNSPQALKAEEYEELMSHLIERCLFTFESKPLESHITKDIDLQAAEKVYQNKCMSSSSRDAAYELLITICDITPSQDVTTHEQQSYKEPTLIGIVLSKYWLPLLSRIQKPKKSGFAPRNESRSFFGYCGIKNLGSICYMNSMIQQFFHVPTFRYSLLAADDKMQTCFKDFEGDQVNDNLLHQFMKYMAFLELSERQDYNPREFCFAFKDFDGQPTNVRIQQDSQEFLNLAFDRVEHLLANTTQKYLLQNVFGGKTCSLMICKSCGNLRQRQEDFYNLQLEVKNQKTIYEGLNKFTLGEIINDFQCEACGKRVDVERKTVIEKLPNVLIVHLQRIVFDFETMMNAKLNSRVEFPNVLNLKPYMLSEIMKQEKEQLKKAKLEKKRSQEIQIREQQNDNMEDEKQEEDNGKAVQEADQQNELLQKDSDADNEDAIMIDDSEFEYKLAGVVLHMGVAEAGHYLSYINIHRNRKEETNPEWLKTEDERWMEFNDSHVCNYNFKNLEEDCFGGSSLEIKGATSSNDYKNDYSRNAYMLIYEKRMKEPLKIVVPEELINKESDSLVCEGTAISRGGQEPSEDKLHVMYTIPALEERIKNKANIIYDNEKKEHYTLVDFNMVEKFVPQNLYKMVYEDNQLFLAEKQIFNNSFFKCTNNMFEQLIVKMPEYLQHPEHSQQLFDFMERIIFDFLVMSSENKQLCHLTKLYISMLSQNDDQMRKLIKTRILNFNVGEQKNKDQKTFFDQLVSNFEKDVRVVYGDLLTFVVNRLFELEEMEMIDQIMKIVFGFLPEEASRNWLKIHQYLSVHLTLLISQSIQFLLTVTISGSKQLQYMAEHGLITKLIDFFLESDSPLYHSSQKRQQMGSSYANPPMESLIQNVSFIARNLPYIPAEQDFFKKEEQISPYYTKCVEQLVLSQSDVNMLQIKQFYSKALGLGQEAAEVGRLCAHVSFNNFTFSNRIAKKILTGINKSTSDDVLPYLAALEHFLYIRDRYAYQRIEWMLGIPQLKIERANQYQMNSQNAPPLKMGVSIIDNMNDDIFDYRSTLFKNTSTVKDAILQIMFQLKNRFSKYTMFIIQSLLNATCNDSEGLIYKYLKNIDPPTYDYSRYIDWILPYISTRIQSCTSYPNMGTNKQELQIATHLYSLYETIEKRFEDEDYFKQKQSLNRVLTPNVNNGGSEPYLIWNMTAQKILEEQNFPEFDIKIIVKEIQCVISQSAPTGQRNLAIPSQQLSRNNNNHQSHGYNLRPAGIVNNNNNQNRPKQFGRGMNLNSVLKTNAMGKNVQSVQTRRLQKNKKRVVQQNNLFPSDVDQAAYPEYAPQDAQMNVEPGEADEEEDQEYEDVELEQEVKNEEDTNDQKKQNYEQIQVQDISQDNQQEIRAPSQSVVPGSKNSQNQQQESEIQMNDQEDYWQLESWVILLFQVQNNDYVKAQKVIIEFKQKDGSTEPLNFQLPISPVPCQVFSNKEKDVIVFTKLRPFDEGWGEFDYIVKVKEPKPFKFSIQPSQSPEKFYSNPNEIYGPQQAETKDVEMALENVIVCMTCTFHNKPSSNICEMCDNDIKFKTM